jgi:hypothetical protein
MKAHLKKKRLRMIVMRKVSSASRKTYRKMMSYVNNYLNITMIRTLWSSFVCKERNSTMLSFKIIRGILIQVGIGGHPPIPTVTF